MYSVTDDRARAKQDSKSSKPKRSLPSGLGLLRKLSHFVGILGMVAFLAAIPTAFLQTIVGFSLANAASFYTSAFILGTLCYFAYKISRPHPRSSRAMGLTCMVLCLMFGLFLIAHCTLGWGLWEPADLVAFNWLTWGFTTVGGFTVAGIAIAIYD